MLVGPNIGKTGFWGGFRFENGSCELTDQDADKVRQLLGNFYAAWPAELAKEKHQEYLESLSPEDRAVAEDHLKSLLSGPNGEVHQELLGDGQGAIELAGPVQTSLELTEMPPPPAETPESEKSKPSEFRDAKNNKNNRKG
jgi:hypothetical protein